MSSTRPSRRTLIAALRTTEAFREFIRATHGRPAPWRIDVYAHMIDLELERDNSRRSVVHKLFTMWAALGKARDWAILERQL